MELQSREDAQFAIRKERGDQKIAPPNEGNWCDYATDWAETKAEWDLTMTVAESDAVAEMLGTCEEPPKFEVETLDHMKTVTGEH